MPARLLSGSTACFRCPLQGGPLRRRPSACCRAESQQRRPTPKQEDLLISDTQQPSSSVKEDELTGAGTGVNGACSVEEDGNATASESGVTLNQLGSLLLLISPFFFWGTSMVAMKALSPHTAPLFVSAIRMLPAGLALICWAIWDKRPQPRGAKAWLWIAAFGFADATCFQGFLAEGLQRTSAGLGSVIIDSQPLSVALLASYLFGEQLSLVGYAGLGIGVVGLCLLEVPPQSLSAIMHHGISGFTTAINPQHMVAPPQSLWDSGEWWMLLSAQSMAIGTVLVRYVSKHADPVMATGYHMLLGGLPLLLLSIQQESSILADRLPKLTGSDSLLLLYISLLGSAASYGVFFLNASRGNLTALSSLTFLTPCFAAGAGLLFLGETLTPLQLLGAGVTLGGVYFISNSPADT